VAWLLATWLNVDSTLWAHLLRTQLLELLLNTLALAAGVFISVSIVGASLAWLVVRYEFPGRTFFEWALVLSFAVPAYVFAFLLVGTLDGAAPFMVWLRDTTGLNIWPEIRTYWGALLAFTFAFYPYVYVFARSAFKKQGQEVLEVAQSLGCRPLAVFIRVVLPAAWPAIVAGAGLGVMEALADFGTVAIFNYSTFTTAIYKSWFGFFSIQTAAQLASWLVLSVFTWRWFETKLVRQPLRGGELTAPAGRLERIKLTRLPALLVTLLMSLVFAVSFGIPLVQLVRWTFQSFAQARPEQFIDVIWRSFILAFGASVVILISALFLAVAARMDGRRRVANAMRFATVGYALPGSILAVGLMLAVTSIQNGLELLGWSLQLIGGLFVLILAYLIRYLAVGVSGTTAALATLPRHIGEAAQVLGASMWRRIRLIYGPLLAPGLGGTLLLVMVDLLKEMPATLLLRPYGWDTLAVSIYGYTSEGDWMLAALPGLLLVAVGLLPVFVLLKRLDRDKL